jgi:hypothetical protein
MVRKPKVQILLLAIISILGGIMLFGQFLDAISIFKKISAKRKLIHEEGENKI